MTARRIKVLAWITVAIVAIRVVPAVAGSKALALFCLNGIVPYTHVVLSPNGVFGVLAGFFVLCVVAIFWSEWRKLARWIFKRSPQSITSEQAQQTGRRRNRTMQVAASTPAQASPMPRVIHAEELVHSAALPTAPLRPQQAARVGKPQPVLVITTPRTPGTFTRASSQLSPALKVLRLTAKRLSLTISLTMLLALRRAHQAAHKLIRATLFTITREGLRLFIHTRIWTNEAWRWLKPHLQDFDAWLEMQVKARQGDTTRTFSAVVREARKGMNEFKGSLETARRQTHVRDDEKLLGDADNDAL